MSYFLDTNMCIYFLNGRYPNLVEKLMSYEPEEIKIPSIVKAELLYGAEKSNNREKTENIVTQFLFPFEIVSFDEISAEYYADIRASLEKSGTPIGPNDIIVASTVLSNNGILITNNTKEFKRIEELKIDNWIK